MRFCLFILLLFSYCNCNYTNKREVFKNKKIKSVVIYQETYFKFTPIAITLESIKDVNNKLFINNERNFLGRYLRPLLKKQFDLKEKYYANGFYLVCDITYVDNTEDWVGYTEDESTMVINGDTYFNRKELEVLLLRLIVDELDPKNKINTAK